MSIRSGCQVLMTVGFVVLLLGAGGRDLPPLIDAAKKGDREALRVLVEQGADVNVTGPDGTAALHWVCLREDADGVDMLIRAGADVNLANDLGATPLWVASLNGSTHLVEKLLSAGADPNIVLRHGETPLMSATRSGSPAVVEMLLEHGADPDARGPRGQTALMWAVADRQSEVVRVLTRYGADVSARSDAWTQLKAHEPHPHAENQIWVTQGGNTALMFAARVGDLASARHLVAAGADVNDTTAWGISAVAMAAYSDFGAVVADATYSSGGPFHLGGREVLRPGEFGKLVEFLLAQGADPNLGVERFTALHAAVMRRNERTVRVLLEYGADPNARLATFTPIQRGSTSSFYFHRAWMGATPFWLAARFGTPAILRNLAEHGADPRFVHRGVYYAGSGAFGSGIFANRQEEVTTPLMAAIGMSGAGRAWVIPQRSSADLEAEIFEKAKLLVELGVDVNVVNEEGRTALEHARDLEYESVVGLLVEIGAQEGELRRR